MPQVHAISTCLKLVNTSLDVKLRIARLAKEKSLDFDDAYQYYIARLHNLKIVRFDTDFDKGKIPRIEPSQMVAGKNLKREKGISS